VSTNCTTDDLGCKVRNPLFHTGTSQRERFLAALDPGYIKADEHTLEDFLIFASQYAAQLNYYSTDNTISGDWQDLINSDPTIILARMTVTQTTQIKNSFEDKVKNLLDNYGSFLNGNNDAADFGLVIKEIVNAASLIDYWYTVQFGTNPTRQAIEEFITKRLSAQIVKLISYDKGASGPDGGINLPRTYVSDPSIYASLSSVWNIDYLSINPDSSIYTGVNDKNKISNGIDEIRLIFNVIYQAIVQLVSVAESLLTDSLSSPEHKPHIALFISFLRLFRYAQDDLNKFTQKHIDYYYEEVLRLSETQAQPDRVFLIFELAQNVSQHLLTTGTQFEAGTDSQGNDVTFAAVRDVVLNKGSIGALNTVFTEISGDDVINVYAATGANTKNGLGQEPLAEGKYWPLLGENQDGKADADKTMQNAVIGFAMSSPVFFLSSGTRTISIQIYPSNDVEFPVDDISAIEADILNSLRISLSAGESYLVKKPSHVMLVTGTGSELAKVSLSYMRIDVVLDTPDPAITAYDATVLGDTFDTIWPLLKGVFDSQELSVVSYKLQEYQDTTPYSNFYSVGDPKPNNRYVLLNGVIYKLIASVETTGQNPELHPESWERIENVQDLVADLDATALPFSVGRRYEMGDFAKINGQYNVVIEKKHDGTVTWEPVSAENSYAYKYFKNIRIKTLAAGVNVQGVTDLILHSEDAALDHNKPFTPFGSSPDAGAVFYLGNTEIFQKQITYLNINIVWDKLPDINFGTYYTSYEPGVSGSLTTGANPTSSAVTNDSFRMHMDVLDKGKWVSITGNDPLHLFDTQFGLPGNPNPPMENRTILIDGANLNRLSNIKRDPYMKSFTSFDHGLAKGFARFTLQRTTGTSAFKAFGHKERPLLFTERVINKSTGNLPNLLPNEAYTPLMKELTVDYQSFAIFNVAATNPLDFKNRVDQLFHIEAFGQNEVHRQLLGATDELFVVPQYNDEGTLYIGLNNIAPLENITLLFQFKEGTEDTSVNAADIVWSYMSKDRWFELPSGNIVYDTTNKFVQSGIMEIALPEEMTNNNTVLPTGMLWLKASAQINTTALNKVLLVAAQSAEVDFVNNNNDLNRLRTGLPANIIQDLVSRDVEVDKIIQPFASFDGKVQEESGDFYNRVSERLRHKSRAIEIWDYERLVLENFPSVYRTKCLNHTSTIKNITDFNLEQILATETNPGFVTMVVIPQLRDFVTQEIFEPKVGIATMENIKTYLSQYISPFVQLEVENPLYERVQAQFEVVFMPGLNKAFYTAKLNEDINQFLAPWAFDSSRDITFGGRLQRSVLINFIEERPYVDFVLHFHLLQQSCIGSETYKEVDEARARTSRSVLSSGGIHLITALDKDEVICDDGIGYMIEQRSFIVR